MRHMREAWGGWRAEQTTSHKQRKQCCLGSTSKLRPQGEEGTLCAARSRKPSSFRIHIMAHLMGSNPMYLQTTPITSVSTLCWTFSSLAL